MALALTIQQVKDTHPRLLSGLSKDALMPNMAAAEEKYVVPLTGRPLYNDINTKFNANTLAGLEVQLHQYMRAVSVAGAYMDEVGRNAGKITDNGNRTANSNEMQRMFGWEYKEMKQGIIDLYYDSIEVLLVWLYANKASFALWTASDEYAKFDALLIKTAVDFNEQYKLYQPYRTYWSLRPLVQDVQDNYHSIALGKALLAYLMGATATSADEKEIIRVLKKAMAFLTVYRTCRMYPVRFSDAGFSIVGSETDAQSSTQSAAGIPLWEQLMRAAENDGLLFLSRAKKMCSDLRTLGTVPAFNTAYDAGPLAAYVAPTVAAMNEGLTKSFRMGV